MQIATIDWVIIFSFFAITLGIGIYVSKTSGKSANDFFLSGRTMPWWLLGLSMVATTFSTDTPNLVTDIVRTNGVSGNWVWWAFLITGLLTVFVYAKLWRKSNVNTDLKTRLPSKLSSENAIEMNDLEMKSILKIAIESSSSSLIDNMSY